MYTYIHTQESENDKQSISCQICGNTNCNRHTELINTELIMVSIVICLVYLYSNL